MITVAVIMLLLSLLYFTFLFLFLSTLKKHKISFKESMNLTGLPVITFVNNNKKLNFLLDTGSNDSYINSTIIDELNYTKLETTNTVVAAFGTAKTSVIKLDITYNGTVFTDCFNCLDLSEPFEEIKESDGVQIHGILGTGFFEKYKYILDFSELALYIK